MEKKTYIKPELEITMVASMPLMVTTVSAIGTDADPNEEMLVKDWCKWEGEDINEY